jgi:hypothetical protein
MRSARCRCACVSLTPDTCKLKQKRWLFASQRHTKDLPTEMKTLATIAKLLDEVISILSVLHQTINM